MQINNFHCVEIFHVVSEESINEHVELSIIQNRFKYQKEKSDQSVFLVKSIAQGEKLFCNFYSK